MPPDFDNKEYWQQRFAHETAFEWLVSSTDFMRVLEPYLEKLPKAARILHLGIGTSELHNHLRMLGFSDITNIDYEPMAIERSKQLEEKAFGDVRMQYLVADVTELESDRLRGGLFDLVVDKSTADAVSCGGEEAIARMARAVRRCLGDGGVWVSLSYSSSRFQVECEGLDANVIATIPTPKHKATDPDIYHWCYLLRAI